MTGRSGRSIGSIGSIGRGRARSIGSVHRSVGVALDRSGRARSIGSIGSIGRGRARSVGVALDRVGPSSIASVHRRSRRISGRDSSSSHDPMAPHRARRVLSRNVAWVIPFGIVGIRHDRLDGPMDEIPPRARGGARDAHPATSRDARPREDATGTRVSGGRRSSLGNFTRRDDEVASAEEDERGGRASIDRFVPHRDCVGID